ncbi:MAG: ABC transporter permease [Candidatus Heimdallarchaeota archaeon]|nr:ABC transporter permease [Candidatus Heimdallarchaeota archaeon]
MTAETPSEETSQVQQSDLIPKIIITVGFILFGVYQAFTGILRVDDVTLGEYFGDSYSQSAEAGDIFSSVLIMTAFAATILLATMLLNKNEIMIRLRLLISLIFGWLVLTIISDGSHNFAVILVAIVIAPTILWYYLSYGEVKSYFANRYIVFTFRRLLAMVPLFISLSFFTFFLSNEVGDPVAIMLGIQRVNTDVAEAALRAKFGLDRPIHIQYFDWTWGFLHGDMGLSFKTQNPVNVGFNDYLYETLKMQITSLIISFIFAVALGVAAAYYHNTLVDSTVSAIALLGLSMPIFVSGITAILIFSGTGLGWFPSAGAHSISILLPAKDPGEMISTEFSTKAGNINWWLRLIQVWWIYTTDGLHHLVLPVLTLVFATMATFARLTRGSMLEILRQDYILAARANGLSEMEVIWKHAFRNVLLPLVTFLGLNIGVILAGAPITETVFTWPGLGRYFIFMLGFIDIPVMVSITMVITVMILISNLITDIAYTFVDPRVTL